MKRFNLGDCVKVSGYEKTLFEVNEYIYKMAIDSEGLKQVEHQYHVKYPSGQIIVAFDEDIIMVKPRGSIDMNTVDKMLDSYNDDMLMFEITGDESYHTRAKKTIKMLQKSQIVN